MANPHCSYICYLSYLFIYLSQIPKFGTESVKIYFGVLPKSLYISCKSFLEYFISIGVNTIENRLMKWYMSLHVIYHLCVRVALPGYGALAGNVMHVCVRDKGRHGVWPGLGLGCDSCEPGGGPIQVDPAHTSPGPWMPAGRVGRAGWHFRPGPDLVCPAWSR